MNTIRLAEVSPTWGAHDSFATRRAIHRAAAEADEIERDRLARKELLAEDFMSALEEGDLTARAIFAEPKRNGVRPSVGEVLLESMDYENLSARLMQLLVDTALGMETKEKAEQLLADCVKTYVEMES
jgi:hypothetical protein